MVGTKAGFPGRAVCTLNLSHLSPSHGLLIFLNNHFSHVSKKHLTVCTCLVAYWVLCPLACLWEGYDLIGLTQEGSCSARMEMKTVSMALAPPWCGTRLSYPSL